MPVTIDGDTGVSKIQDGAVVQSDLASGVAGTGPAFSAYHAGGQTLSTSVQTKVQFNVEEFDTASAFDAATNYRFQPSVAGYYQLNSGILFAMNGLAGTYFIALFKNGAEYKRGSTTGGSNVQNSLSVVSSLVYLNGTTDYVEVFGFQNSGISVDLQGFGTAVYVYFNGFLARSA